MTSSTTPADNSKLLAEPNPDVWTFLNPPGTAPSSGAGNLPFSEIPEPLERAWTAWLQGTNGNSTSLKDDLIKGWRNSRRERHKRAILEAQARQKEEAAAKQAAEAAAQSKKKGGPGRKENKINNAKSCGKTTTHASKQKGLQEVHGDNDAANASKKKKGIQFSADTKQSSKSETKSKKRARSEPTKQCCALETH